MSTNFKSSLFFLKFKTFLKSNFDLFLNKFVMKITNCKNLKNKISRDTSKNCLKMQTNIDEKKDRID